MQTEDINHLRYDMNIELISNYHTTFKQYNKTDVISLFTLLGILIDENYLVIIITWLESKC